MRKTLQHNGLVLQGKLSDLACLGQNMRGGLEQLNAQAISYNSQIEVIFTELNKFRRTQIQDSEMAKSDMLRSLTAIESSQGAFLRTNDCSRTMFNEIKDTVEQMMARRQSQDVISAHGYENGFLDSEATQNPKDQTLVHKTICIHYLKWDPLTGFFHARFYSQLANSSQAGTLSKNGPRVIQTLRFRLTYKALLWFSTTIVQLIFRAQSQSQHNLTGWRWNLSVSIQRYSLDPDLIRYVNGFDIEGLRKIFVERRTRANGYQPNGWPLLYVDLNPWNVVKALRLTNLHLSTR